METKIVCPLGCECQHVVGDHVEQCAWYVEMEGKSPQDGKDIKQSKCAMAWQPILMIENSLQTREVSRSVQSLRNETVLQQQEAVKVLKGKL